MVEWDYKYMPRYDRLSILVSLILFGVVVSQVVELPTRIISFVALGVPTKVYLSSRWFIGAVLVLLTGSGTDSIVRSHPHARQTDSRSRLSYWGLPCALTSFSLFLLPLAPSTYLWVAGLALTGLCLGLTIVAQYYTVDRRDRHYQVARWGLNVAVYLAVVALCTLIYAARARSLLSATSIAVLGAVLGAELLRSQASNQEAKRVWLYALASGAILGEVTWALNHCGLTALAGGIFLLVVFYVTSGLAGQHLRGKLTRHVFVEFSLVAILGLAMLQFI